MSEFIDFVYNKLNAVNNGISKYEFSRDYLGKSESYYPYLNSTNAKESAEVIQNIYGNTLKRAQLYEDIANKYGVSNEEKKNEYLFIAEEALNEFKRTALQV